MSEFPYELSEIKIIDRPFYKKVIKTIWTKTSERKIVMFIDKKLLQGRGDNEK